jgi:hypothetical protein
MSSFCFAQLFKANGPASRLISTCISKMKPQPHTAPDQAAKPHLRRPCRSMQWTLTRTRRTLCYTSEPKTPSVPWCLNFFVPNIKHKGTSGILSKLLKPRTSSLVFRGVLSPRKFFMSKRLLNTTGHQGNTTEHHGCNPSKNLYVPKTLWTPRDTTETPQNTTEHHGQSRPMAFDSKHHGTPR